MFPKESQNILNTSYPLVTVFTLIYNTNPKFVIEAIESVRANNYPNLQHIIIDDCSPNPEPKKVVKEWIKQEDYPCEFYEHDINFGVCKTLNHVLKLAKGKYILGCSDDILLKGSIEAKIMVFEQREKVGLVYTEIECINENGETINNIYKSVIIENNQQAFDILKSTNYIPIASCMFSMQMLNELNGFDESITFEDWDIFLSIAKSNWRIVNIPDVTAKYRIHSNSMWQKKNASNLISIIKIFIKHDLFNKSFGILNYFDFFRTLRLIDKMKIVVFIFKNRQISLGAFYVLSNIKFLRVVRFYLYKLVYLN